MQVLQLAMYSSLSSGQHTSVPDCRAKSGYKWTASAGPYLEVHDILVHLGICIPLGFLKGSQLPSLARQLPFPGHQLPFQLGHPTLQPPLLACQALQSNIQSINVQFPGGQLGPNIQELQFSEFIQTRFASHMQSTP